MRRLGARGSRWLILLGGRVGSRADQAVHSENLLFSTDVGLLGLDDSFLERGIVDSTGMLEVIMFLEETFGIDVADDAMIPENLDSVRRIATFLQRPGT